MAIKFGMTERQKDIYDGIVEYQKEHGFSPTVRELCRICGLASTSSVHSHLKALEDKGYITRLEDSPRTIVVL